MSTEIEDTVFSFDDIKSKIINKSIFWFFIISLLGIIASFSRIPVTGVLISHYIHVGVVISLLIVHQLRDRLSDNVKSGYIVILFSLLGFVGFYNFGSMGGGSIFISCAILYTLMFHSKKTYRVVITIIISILVLFAYLFISGHFTYRFNMVAYSESAQSWIILTALFIIFTAVIHLLLSGLMEKVKESISMLLLKNKEIQTLNSSLASKVEELNELNREKDSILGVVAHDLNNKLGGIVGYLDLMTLQFDELGDDRKFFMLNKLKDIGNDTTEIVADLLDFAKLDSSSSDIIYLKTEISAFISNYYDNYYPKAKKKNIRITQHICENCECLVSLNKARFSRVLDNLISNAIKFTSDGGEISIGLDQDKNDTSRIVISITDNGIGIPQELQKDLFIPFTKSGRSGTNNEQSTGLGLSIVKKIVDQHRGSIWFESEEGVGTTFYVSLPKVQ